MHDAVLPAFFPKQRHQLPVPVTLYFVGVTVLFPVSLFHTGKVPVQRGIEILAVAVAQRHPHAKADDAVHLRLDALIQDPFDIFPCIIDKRQDRRQPDDCRYLLVPKNL